MNESKKLSKLEQPTGLTPSASGQTVEQSHVTMSLTMSERPLHDYVSAVCERTDIRVGVPLPLGAYARSEGVNFAFFSRHASHVWLELFDHPNDAAASRVIDLDPARNRIGDVWHVWVEGIRPGQLYAYRVDGPYQPKDGHRFNFNKLLLDPFATAISKLPTWEFAPARRYDPPVPDGDSVCSAVDNAGAEAVAFHVPPPPHGAQWRLAVDTSHDAPHDVFDAGDEPLVNQSQAYPLSAWASVILVAHPPTKSKEERT